MDDKTPEWLNADENGLARAAELLRAGQLVAIPTETVYGLAARADSETAVAQIYHAKKRPHFNPLIVHVGSVAAGRKLAEFDLRAEELAARFWPGPLTLVLPRAANADVAPAVAAGLATIALRMPAHPVALSLLKQADLPLAAPSANRSGEVSPTLPEHVAHSLGGSVAAILDGGPCKRGMESTIVALRANQTWQLLRPGPIPEEALTELLGPAQPLTEQRIEAPGQLARHYSPGKPVRLDAASPQQGEFMIGFGLVEGDCTLSPTGDLAEAASRLYACLHKAAASDLEKVAVAPIPDQGIGAAINDRLRRAAAS